MEAPTGLCASCRHLSSRVYRYTVVPWECGYICLKTVKGAPHNRDCPHYEREPGAELDRVPQR